MCDRVSQSVTVCNSVTVCEGVCLPLVAINMHPAYLFIIKLARVCDG